jgi:hypothetical protein
MKKTALVGSCLLAVMLATPQIASARDIKGKTGGYCTLTNVRADKEIYNGDCTIKQTIKPERTVWEIKLGNAEPFLFAGNGTQYMHGPEEATFKDYGNTGVFSWGEFVLKATQD